MYAGSVRPENGNRFSIHTFFDISSRIWVIILTLAVSRHVLN